MLKKDGIGWVIYCDICGRKIGSFYGIDNEQETRNLCSIYTINGDDVCWVCNKLIKRRINK